MNKHITLKQLHNYLKKMHAYLTDLISFLFHFNSEHIMECDKYSLRLCLDKLKLTEWSEMEKKKSLHCLDILRRNGTFSTPLFGKWTEQKVL